MRALPIICSLVLFGIAANADEQTMNLKIKSSKSSYKLGENVLLSAVFINMSGHELELIKRLEPYPDTQLEPGKILAEITATNILDLEITQVKNGAQEEMPVVIYSAQLPRQAGQYELRLRYKLRDGLAGDMKELSWTPITSNVIKIKIINGAQQDL